MALPKKSSAVARRYRIGGRVQGVGYRDFVQRTARAIGLAGYARNLDDGRVEVYASGTPGQLAELVGYLYKGPLLSDVRSVEESEAAPEHCDGFRIR